MLLKADISDSSPQMTQWVVMVQSWISSYGKQVHQLQFHRVAEMVQRIKNHAPMGANVLTGISASKSKIKDFFDFGLQSSIFFDHL